MQQTKPDIFPIKLSNISPQYNAVCSFNTGLHSPAVKLQAQRYWKVRDAGLLWAPMADSSTM